jgi:hypothetical protein
MSRRRPSEPGPRSAHVSRSSVSLSHKRASTGVKVLTLTFAILATVVFWAAAPFTAHAEPNGQRPASGPASGPAFGPGPGAPGGAGSAQQTMLSGRILGSHRHGVPGVTVHVLALVRVGEGRNARQESAWRQRGNREAWTVVASATTDRDGDYKVRLKNDSARYHVDFLGRHDAALGEVTVEVQAGHSYTVNGEYRHDKLALSPARH